MPLPRGTAGTPGVGREGRPGSPSERASFPGLPWALGISTGTRFAPCTFGPCCPSTSQPCPAPPQRAPGSVASSCHHLISLPVMPPLSPSFLGQTNPSVGCRSPSKSCLATKAGGGVASFPRAPAPGRAEPTLPGLAPSRGALAQVCRQQAPRPGGPGGLEGRAPKRGMREEGSLAGRGAQWGLVWQGGKCQLLRGLAMEVPRVRGGGPPWPCGRKHGWEISWPPARPEMAREPRKGALPGLRGFAPAPSPRGE